jgi:amino acid transporter
VSTTIQSTSEPTSVVVNSLRRNSLSAWSVTYFMMGAIGVLLVVAGVIPTFFAVTGITGAPIYFLAVALVLALFAPGYVAMARHIPNAGAFYAFITKGLGRPLGVAGALVAVLAYNMLQVSIYGLFGPQMAAWAVTNLGVDWPWWFWSLLTWALVMFLGLRQVGVSAKVLAALSIVEIVVVVVIDALGLLHPSPTGSLSLGAMAPHDLMAGGAAAAGLIMGVLGYIGFESAPVFGEEARDRRRTIAFATYLTLAAVTVVYVLSAVAMLAHYGPDQVATVAGQQGPEMMFNMTTGDVAGIGRGLFLTSMFAALLAYHNFVGRYMYSLGREGTLPRMFGRTGARSSAPWVASLAQSAIALLVILVVATQHWDPVFSLFFWSSTTGGFGILVLLAVTSVAVVGFFARTRQILEPVWRRTIAPIVSGVLLIGMVVLAVRNYPTLIGVPDEALAAKLLPASYLVPLAAGLLWAVLLRARRPRVYTAIGLGPDAILGVQR